MFHSILPQNANCLCCLLERSLGHLQFLSVLFRLLLGNLLCLGNVLFCSFLSTPKQSTLRFQFRKPVSASNHLLNIRSSRRGPLICMLDPSFGKSLSLTSLPLLWFL